MDRTFGMSPDIAALFGCADGPESYTLALIGQLRPLTHWIGESAPCRTGEEIDRIGWIAMELVSNAIASALGSALGAATGFPREALLRVFGTSVIWPGPETSRRADGSGESLHAVREVLGMEPADWLRLPVAERFATLGIDALPPWVRLECRLDPEEGELDLRVSSERPPLEGDLEEIRRRLTDPAGSRARIAGSVEPHRDPAGMVHMPSFTGGGGMGLILCAETARSLGMALDLLPREGVDSGVTLRLHGRSGPDGSR